ncbi:2-C-methyl-D-erythritol 2,4-cyclodiphosphate synthase [Lyticum sinuosum]|nr:2-C-methyl-D-erythritol 2,4-cyclodiphosphate synthase [Lyticum sinuosum]
MYDKNIKTIALILSCGSGSRYAKSLPNFFILQNIKKIPTKQYEIICDKFNKTVLEITIESFLLNKLIDNVVVCIDKNHYSNYYEIEQRIKIIQNASKLISPLCLNSTDNRQETVRLSLNYLMKIFDGNSKILIHDGVRPLVSQNIISSVVKSLDHYRAVDLGINLNDSLREKIKKNNNTIKLKRNNSEFKSFQKNKYNLVNRDNYYLVQTPQGFYLEDICNLHNIYKDYAVTDDISFCDLSNINYTFVRGESSNIKITSYNDLLFVKTLLKNQNQLKNQEKYKENNKFYSDKKNTQEDFVDLHFEYRIGYGFDIHSFIKNSITINNLEEKIIENNSIIIGGCKIPSTYKIRSHSDGDLVFHAITDAILGTVSGGSIGTIFPNTDKRFESASSAEFVKYAYNLLNSFHGKIVNIDVCVIAEEPQIMPYAYQIKKNIASLLDIEMNRINIKATTSEKIGFIGRTEGIAAQVVCLSKIPIKQ